MLVEPCVEMSEFPFSLGNLSGTVGFSFIGRTPPKPLWLLRWAMPAAIRPASGRGDSHTLPLFHARREPTGVLLGKEVSR